MRFVILLVCLSMFCSCQEAVVKPPNILFIMSDDHTSQAWGVYGGRLEAHVKNDNIKRLVNEGSLLKNVFATNSICVPSRGSILTGQYSHQNNIYSLSDPLSPDSMNIAKALQGSGYETAIIGKWHLQQEPTGFDHYMVLPGQGLYNNPRLKTKSDWQDGNKGGKVYKGFSADVIGDQSVEWLTNRRNAKPFFLMTHFKSTHEPFDYPERYNDLLEDVVIEEPHDLLDFSPETNGRSFIGQKLWILHERWLADQKDMSHTRYPGLPIDTEGMDSIEIRKFTYQKFVKDFIRCGAAIDDNIGKLLDYLDQAGLAENTVVIYTADQGYFLGEHGMFDKRMFYEEAMRMPFVIRYPKEIKGGSSIDDIILNLDFPALFADYAGIEKQDFVQGRSFRYNLKGDTPKDWRQSMYYRYWLHRTERPAHFAIRNHRYKLGFFYGLPLDMTGAMQQATEPSWEFYDLKKDPTESRNAYGNPKYSETINELKKELAKLRSDVGDTDDQYPEMQELLKEYWD